MKRNLLFLIIGLFSLTAFAQQGKYYAKFSQEPPRKLIKGEIKKAEFFVEYKTKKEATIYLELVKDGKGVANCVRTVKSKKPKTMKFVLSPYKNARIIPGSSYSYKLYMFEGPKHTFEEKIGSTTVIEDIKVSRLY